MTYKEPYFPPHGGGMDSHSIEASNQTLLRQAPMTADEYLRSAIDCIDAQLGKGYAKQHPELIGAFMRAAATDLGAAVIARAVEALADTVSNEFRGIVEAARSDHPLQGETLDGIANALNDIATAVKKSSE